MTLLPPLAAWRNVLALGAGGLVVLVAVGFSLFWSYTEEREAFHGRTDNSVRLLVGRVEQAAAASAALATLFQADQYVDADQFRVLATGLLKRWSFLRAAVYAPRVRPANRGDFEAAVRDQGLPGFSVHGADGASEVESHFPLRYIEPFTPLTARRLGLDLAGWPPLPAALQAAHGVDREILATAPGLLAEGQEPWLFRPLQGGRGQTQGNSGSMVGVVGIALDPAGLAEGLHGPDTRLRLVYPGEIGEVALFDGGEAGERGEGWSIPIAENREIPFGGKVLLAQFDQEIDLLRLARLHTAIALALGVAATLLLLLLAAQFTARRQAEMALRRSHAQLEQRVHQRTSALNASNAELQQFAYVVSHDLQEPLRMVSSYLQLLSRRYRGRLDDEADEFIGFAADGARRMSAMIDGLLQYARVETQGQPFAETDLEQVLTETLANLSLAIEEAGALVEHGPLPRLQADATQMQRLFQNLIGNALKFRGDAPPQIRIDAEREGGLWAISVTDNGIGIPPAQAERIFLMFQRLHTREEYPGLGIGLAVCRRIVERHGGRIEVRSNPGGGAIFRFTLPAGDGPSG